MIMPNSINDNDNELYTENNNDDKNNVGCSKGDPRQNDGYMHYFAFLVVSSFSKRVCSTTTGLGIREKTTCLDISYKLTRWVVCWWKPAAIQKSSATVALLGSRGCQRAFGWWLCGFLFIAIGDVNYVVTLVRMFLRRCNDDQFLSLTSINEG